jgi:serine/threonine-protein kinase
MVGRVFLGRYEPIRLLGEGGMGRVYLARQLDLGRLVVVKVMHDHIAADAKFRERFERETLLMARFQHPYAVTLYDASLNDPCGPCIIMEYVRGVPLDTLVIRNGRLTPTRIGRLLGQLCEVLQVAHAMGMIHRDLKPANLMVVDPDTPYEKVKVMDFGLATLLGRKSGKTLTDSENEFAVGTPGYICPEQVLGQEPDHRGDLYSVGIILFELLTGKLPFAAKSSMDILIAHATEPPPSFAEAGAPGWTTSAVEKVVMACLAKDPAARPASARDLAERYALALEEVDAAPGQTPDASEAATVDTTAVSGGGPHPPGTVIHEIKAWMPQTVATHKLRGFVQDVGGEVVESAPGRIRVRLGGWRATVDVTRSPRLSWLGLSKKRSAIEIELTMNRSGSDNLLLITIAIRPVENGTPIDTTWHDRCTQIFCNLRAYLMGNNGKVADVAG